MDGEFEAETEVLEGGVGVMISPAVGSAEPAADNALQPRGRESGAKGYKPNENIVILNAYKNTPGSLTGGHKGPLIESVIAKIKIEIIDYQRSEKALHDHATEMITGARSAMMSLSQ